MKVSSQFGSTQGYGVPHHHVKAGVDWCSHDFASLNVLTRCQSTTTTTHERLNQTFRYGRVAQPLKFWIAFLTNTIGDLISNSKTFCYKQENNLPFSLNMTIDMIFSFFQYSASKN